MFERVNRWIQALIVVGALSVVLGVTSPLLAQTSPRFGLSGAPDHYVDEIQIAIGDEATLYLIALGPTDDVPLLYDIYEFVWFILEPC